MLNNLEMLNTALADNGILTITLSRPKALNALNAQLLDELYQVIQAADASEKVKALLITGDGEKAFCAGADINQLKALNAQQGLEFAHNGQRIFRALEQLGKPSLAAINGYTFGGGCELAMAASMRIANTKAVFGQPEVKLGVLPCYGGTQRLARLVGKGRAIDLCITGRSIKATEALQWGLITEITEPDQLIERAKEILSGILSMAPLAVKAVLNTIDTGFDLSLDDAQQLEATQFAVTCASKDKAIGVNAFLEKATPTFIGE